MLCPGIENTFATANSRSTTRTPRPYVPYSSCEISSPSLILCNLHPDLVTPPILHSIYHSSASNDPLLTPLSPAQAIILSLPRPPRPLPHLPRLHHHDHPLPRPHQHPHHRHRHLPHPPPRHLLLSAARAHVRIFQPPPRTNQRHNGHHLLGHALRRLRRRVALPAVTLQPHRRLFRDRHGDAARAWRLEMGHAVDRSGAALGDGGAVYLAA